MEVNEIVSIVGNLGFPIGCCIYMLWKSTKESDRVYDLYKELNSKYDELVEELRRICEVIASNNK